MNSFFSPGMAVLRRLQFAPRFILIGISLFVPLVVTLYLLVKEINVGIEFAHKERLGVEYNFVLRKFLQDLPQHRAMVAQENISKENLTANETQIDADIDAIDRVDGESGALLLATERWGAIKVKWKEIKTKGRQEAGASHLALNADVATLIVHIGDTSNLILDPSLDSYYLMDTIVTKLPALVQSLGQAMEAGNGTLVRGSIDVVERTDLIMQLSLMRSTLNQIRKNFEVASGDNSSIKPLGASLHQLDDATTALLLILDRKIVHAGRLAIGGAEYLAAAKTAVDASFVYYDAVSPVLDRLLAARIAEFENRKLSIALIAFVGWAIGLYLLAAFYLAMIQTINTANQAAKRIAGGDLTGTIARSGRGEIGKILDVMQTMQANLARLVHEVRKSAGSVSLAGEEIALGNDDLSTRTEEQASALEETAASMEELASTTQQNAQHSKEAVRLAQGAIEVAAHGKGIVGDVVTTIDKVHESSKQIVSIIDVIEGIAFQTNLLALNAAVEAARAGEHGLGFSVVASEVRTLAHRSAAAAKDIKTLIGNAVDKVHDGTKLAREAEKAMDEIVGSAKKVAVLIEEVASASEEQSAGIEQVNSAMMQIEGVTQKNAALVEEATATARVLRDQANALNTTVSVFKLRE